MINNPLRYEITDWFQLSKCLSNNSSKYSIRVSKLLGDKISGTLIEVKHALYGTLFATVVNSGGKLISDVDDSGNVIHELSTEDILKQLARFGFYITYEQEACLPGSQLLVLMSIKTLGYTFISKICAKQIKQGQELITPYVVAFNSDSHPEWLKFGYICNLDDYQKALSDGTALYVDTAYNSTLGFNWDWLSYVASIDQILAVNAN